MGREASGVVILAVSLLAVVPAKSEAQVDVRVALTWEFGDEGWRPYRDVEHSREIVYYAPSPRVRVPRGHMPAPGMCRLWFPGVPPGHQPPAQPCGLLLRSGPHPGAVIVGSPACERGFGEGRRKPKHREHRC